VDMLDTSVAKALLLAGVKPADYDITACDVALSAISKPTDRDLFGCDCSIKVMAAVKLVLTTIVATYPFPYDADEVTNAITEARDIVESSREDRRRCTKTAKRLAAV